MAEGSWEERAAAGEVLAQSAGSDADTRLLELLLDREDTVVTFRTAAALLKQRTVPAFRLLVLASAETDDSHRDWIADAIDEFIVRSQGEAEPFLRQALETIRNGGDAVCSQAAREWEAWYRWS
ncbi:hypothetical protein [Promicromonospora sp. NPDC057488]|uniref:hypothetical protein n=1 Tax=Promicromonospora sp. NPDC057488 TaxID=3346147 RepID=UPI00366C1770